MLRDKENKNIKWHLLHGLPLALQPEELNNFIKALYVCVEAKRKDSNQNPSCLSNILVHFKSCRSDPNLDITNGSELKKLIIIVNSHCSA